MITEIRPCHRSALTHYQNTDCNIFTFAGALWHGGALKLLCGSRVCFAQCLQQMDPCLLVMFAPLGGCSVEDEVSEGWFLLRCWPSLSSLSRRHHHRLHSHIFPFFFQTVLRRNWPSEISLNTWLKGNICHGFALLGLIIPLRLNCLLCSYYMNRVLADSQLYSQWWIIR